MSSPTPLSAAETAFHRLLWDTHDSLVSWACGAATAVLEHLPPGRERSGYHHDVSYHPDGGVTHELVELDSGLPVCFVYEGADGISPRQLLSVLARDPRTLHQRHRRRRLAGRRGRHPTATRWWCGDVGQGEPARSPPAGVGHRGSARRRRPGANLLRRRIALLSWLPPEGTPKKAAPRPLGAGRVPLVGVPTPAGGDTVMIAIESTSTEHDIAALPMPPAAAPQSPYEVAGPTSSPGPTATPTPSLSRSRSSMPSARSRASALSPPSTTPAASSPSSPRSSPCR